MKKLLQLFVFIGLSYAGVAQTQAWCAPGATWHYRVNEMAGVGGYLDGHIKLEVTDTVTILGVSCQSMIGVFTGVNTAMSSSTVISSSTLVNLCTYQNNGVIYIYNAEATGFDTIVNFKAAIGDKWTVITFPFFACPNGTIPPKVTVTDTGHVTINNVSLKRIRFSYPDQFTSASHTVTMIEKIMNTSGFLFPANFPVCITDGISYGNFSCYSDNNFATYNPGNVNCAYITGVKEHSPGRTGVSVYPNPNNGRFTLQHAEALQVEILNGLGISVYKNMMDQAGEATIEFGDFSSGVYYLKTKNKSGITFSKFIKE